MTLKRGLATWEQARDSAMGSGLDSSVDIPTGESLNDIEQSGTLEFLSHRMRFEPRREEQDILTKINDQIDSLIEMNFGNINDLIGEFYKGLEETEFAKMEPADLERMILSVQRVIYLATDTVARLYNDAYFADRVQQDEYWKAYSQPESKKTVADRQAHAYEVTRDVRFYYYYIFSVYKILSEKLTALKDFQKTLEWFRQRSIKTHYA